MPTRERPENELIRLFLSAYENDSWRDCDLENLDETEDGAPEIRATRCSDRKTIVVEHTLIQPYDAYTQEFARLREYVNSIEKDLSLIVPRRSIFAYIAAGVLQKGRNWDLVEKAVHQWLSANAMSLKIGEKRHRISVEGGAEITLLTKVHEIGPHPGVIRLGIDGGGLPNGSLGQTVEKALRTKLDKLVKTPADKRILLFERNEFTLPEEAILREIERFRPSFPNLSKIDEIWFAETVFLNQGIVRFHDGKYGKDLTFKGKDLIIRHN